MVEATKTNVDHRSVQGRTQGQANLLTQNGRKSGDTGTNQSNTSSSRLSKTTACLPIVYGSVAFFLGKKADEYQTHQWTLYLRSPNNEDLSVAISKVVFQLHASFAQPVRELTSPPFEVTERGWGEFEAQIRIVWKEASEMPTLLTHGIKLYPPGSPANTVPTNTEVPVVSETYDEVVFTDPTEMFYKQLVQIASLPKMTWGDSRVQAAFGRFSDEDDFQALLGAQEFVQSELVAVKERLQLVDKETAIINEAIREIQEKAKTTRKSPKGSSSSSSFKKK